MYMLLMCRMPWLLDHQERSVKDSSLEVQRRKILPITLQLKQSKSACSLARTFFRGKGAVSWDASLL